MNISRILKIVPFSVAVMLVACDTDSSSADSSPYGDVRYERHLPGSDASADCYVYKKGHLFSVVMEQHFGLIGEITVVSQLELDSPSKIHEEVSLMGAISPSIVTNYCSQEKALYEESMGGTVTCSKSKVVADVTLGDTQADKLEAARETAVAKLSVSCDDFIEQFEDDVLSEE